MPVAVEFQRVEKHFGAIRALDGVDLILRTGEMVALLGPNGAGKTTLVHLLLGLYTPTAGNVRIGGLDLRELDPGALWARTGAVFQDFTQYHLTVRENVGFGHVDHLADLGMHLTDLTARGCGQSKRSPARPTMAWYGAYLYPQLSFTWPSDVS